MIMDYIRKLVFILVVILVLIFLVDSMAFGMHTADKQDYIFNQYLYITIEDNTNEMIEFKLVNRNKMDVEYSNEYEIQMYKNREWKAFDEEYKFDVVKSSLTSKEVVIETINLKDTYGKLKKGRYRLIKRLGISEVAAEFKVK